QPWYGEICYDEEAKTYATPTYYASLLGLDDLLACILSISAVDVHAQGGLYGNALQAASGGGYEKVVQMLLDQGADVNAQGGEYGNALQAASRRGHEKVVQMLLGKGADVNAQGGYFGNALQAASWRGHEKVVQMLLDQGADVNAQGGEYGNALQAASADGREKIVQMLLEKGADINAQGGEYGNALVAASADGHEKYQNDKHRDCHKVFKTSTYELFKNVNPDRVDGTCQWVLSHPQYLQWYTKAHDDLLWISADPGCGKSVLAKSLVDNELRNREEHTICYFFFKDNEEQDNIATALCALLHQLFAHQPQLIRDAVPVWERNGDKLPKEVQELWRTLLAAARDHKAHDVTCVLDALDECRPSDRRWLIDMLASFYAQISPTPSTTRRNRLKFLVTSRPYDHIEFEFRKTLEDLPSIRLQGEEENDQIGQEIDLVIRMRVAKLATDLKLARQIKEQLEGKLLKMEHRTYLWLYLAIEGIYETYRTSLRPQEASIESLPSTVEDAYEKILSRVTEKQKGDVKKILQIVVGARRPLTVQEIAILLGIATSARPNSLDQAKLDPVRLKESLQYTLFTKPPKNF
ncbi:hypothetical protein H2198_006275, partial [Neophaeococcomyces mojaviensis]